MRLRAYCEGAGRAGVESMRRTSPGSAAQRAAPARPGRAQAALDAFAAAENGTVVQTRGDAEYLHPLPLWRAYGQCVARARRCRAAPRPPARRRACLMTVPVASGGLQEARAPLEPGVSQARSADGALRRAPQAQARASRAQAAPARPAPGSCGFAGCAPQARGAPAGDVAARALAGRRAALQPGGARAHCARAAGAHPARPAPAMPRLPPDLNRTLQIECWQSASSALGVLGGS